MATNTKENQPQPSASEQQSANIKPKIKFLVVDPVKCVGCEICESVCSMVHDNEFNPLNSRINRVRIEPVINTAINCQTCPKPYCIDACKPKALLKDNNNGLIIINYNKCDGCAACVKACPFGAINIHTKINKAIVCDLCESTESKIPQCVEYCPKDAIYIEEIEADSKEEALELIQKIIKRGFPPRKYPEGTVIQRTKDFN